MRPVDMLKMAANLVGILDVIDGVKRMIRHAAGHILPDEADYVAESFHAKTIRTRISMIYAAQFEQLIYTDDNTRKRHRLNKTKTQHNHDQEQRDKQDITNIMHHLRDNELSEALKLLQGPPQLAPKQQIQQELPQLFRHDATFSDA